MRRRFTPAANARIYACITQTWEDDEGDGIGRSSHDRHQHRRDTPRGGLYKRIRFAQEALHPRVDLIVLIFRNQLLQFSVLGVALLLIYKNKF